MLLYYTEQRNKSDRQNKNKEAGGSYPSQLLNGHLFVVEVHSLITQKTAWSLQLFPPCPWLKLEPSTTRVQRADGYGQYEWVFVDFEGTSSGFVEGSSSLARG